MAPKLVGWGESSNPAFWGGGYAVGFAEPHPPYFIRGIALRHNGVVPGRGGVALRHNGVVPIRGEWCCRITERRGRITKCFRFVMRRCGFVMPTRGFVMRRFGFVMPTRGFVMRRFGFVMPPRGIVRRCYRFVMQTGIVFICRTLIPLCGGVIRGFGGGLRCGLSRGGRVVDVGV